MTTTQLSQLCDRCGLLLIENNPHRHHWIALIEWADGVNAIVETFQCTICKSGIAGPESKPKGHKESLARTIETIARIQGGFVCKNWHGGKLNIFKHEILNGKFQTEIWERDSKWAVRRFMDRLDEFPKEARYGTNVQVDSYDDAGDVETVVYMMPFLMCVRGLITLAQLRRKILWSSREIQRTLIEYSWARPLPCFLCKAPNYDREELAVHLRDGHELAEWAWIGEDVNPLPLQMDRKFEQKY